MFWFSGGVQLTTMLVTSGRTWRELGTSGTRVSAKERRPRWDSDAPSFVIFHCPWGKVFRLLPNYLGLSFFFFHYGQEFSKRICMYSEVRPQFNCSLTQTIRNTRHCRIIIIWKERQRGPRAFPMEKNKLSFHCCPLLLVPQLITTLHQVEWERHSTLNRSLLSTGDHVSPDSDDISYLLPKLIW